MLFDEKNDFRLSLNQKEAIKKILEDKKGIYNSVSHFIRSAVIRQIRKEGEKYEVLIK